MKRVFKTSLAALLLSVSVQSMAALQWFTEEVERVYVYSDNNQMYIGLENTLFSGQGCSSDTLATANMNDAHVKEMLKTAQLALATGKRLQVGVNGCLGYPKIVKVIIHQN